MNRRAHVPLDRLERARASLPAGYQFGDAHSDATPDESSRLGFYHQWWCRGIEPCMCSPGWLEGGWRDYVKTPTADVYDDLREHLEQPTAIYTHFFEYPLCSVCQKPILAGDPVVQQGGPHQQCQSLKHWNVIEGEHD